MISAQFGKASSPQNKLGLTFRFAKTTTSQFLGAEYILRRTFLGPDPEFSLRLEHCRMIGCGARALGARSCPQRGQQLGDSERLAPAGAMPSNPPRRARRRSASLRPETNAKRPPEGGLFNICIPGGRGGFEYPSRTRIYPSSSKLP